MLILRVGTMHLHNGDEARLLRARGIACETVGTGLEALEYLGLYDYDLALVDLALPDMEGQKLVLTARSAAHNVPIIILASDAAPHVRVVALDRGADDVIEMPCDFEELLARMRAVVRRSQGHAISVLRFGPVELAMDRHEVRVNGRELRVSRREFSILELLLLKRGVILNKAVFLNHLYSGMDEPMDKTIDVLMCRLRKKLAAFGFPDLIATVWGCGYILRDPSEAAQ